MRNHLAALQITYIMYHRRGNTSHITRSATDSELAGHDIFRLLDLAPGRRRLATVKFMLLERETPCG